MITAIMGKCSAQVVFKNKADHYQEIKKNCFAEVKKKIYSTFLQRHKCVSC